MAFTVPAKSSLPGAAPKRAPRAALVAVVLSLCVACGPQIESGCLSDEDCPAGQRCLPGAALCVLADAAAAPGDARGGEPGDGPTADLAPPRDVRDQRPLSPDAPSDAPTDASPPADARVCEPPGPVAEECNGFDDDCDGHVDEAPDGAPLSRPCYDGPPETEGHGPCLAGVQRCVEGDFGLCVGQVVPSSEVCDRSDNDCDDVVDGPQCDCEPGTTEACFTGPEEAQGHLPCHAGTRTCEDDRLFGPCEGEVVPVDESCNAVDDDCDGSTDEDPDGESLSRPCYEGPAGTDGIGVCRAGVSTCREDGYGPCLNQVRPQPEACDGADNDCNGEVDDRDHPCPCEQDAVLPCYTGPAATRGVGVCHEGQQTCGSDGCAFPELWRKVA